MRIGIDLDNTILDYESAFRHAANRVLGVNFPPGLSKSGQRALVKKKAGEDAWTLLQGYAYGEFSDRAEIFPHFLDFLYFVADIGAEVFVVSHKSMNPILGPKQDLRGMALKNLERLGLIEHFSKPSLWGQKISFCDTKEEKIEKIGGMNFDLFIDDLIGVASSLPSNLESYHIFCQSDHPKAMEVLCVHSWSEMITALENRVLNTPHGKHVES